MWGCVRAPLGVQLYPKPYSGGTFGWAIKLLTHFLGPEFSVDCQAGQGYI